MEKRISTSQTSWLGVIYAITHPHAIFILSPAQFLSSKDSFLQPSYANPLPPEPLPLVLRKPPYTLAYEQEAKDSS